MTEELMMLTVSQVAEIKNVTVHAVRAAIRANQLKAVKVGNVWIIHRKDMDEYSPKPYANRRRVVKTFILCLVFLRGVF
jgi:excisionase family DNA binding protein